MQRMGFRETAALLCAAIGLLGLLALPGCGGDDPSNQSGEGSADASVPDSRPPIEVPEGLPPKRFVVKTLQDGGGAIAKPGDRVSIQYYCVLWNGTQYADSWSYGRVPTFVLGEHRLLRGLNVALRGMREGGGREVTIPYNLVYYPGDSHGHLGRLDALICKTYLVKVVDRRR